MKLDQVTVKVSDIERSTRFYRDLGLRLIVPGTPTYARFVLPQGDSTFSIELDHGHIEPGSVTVYFECDDLDGAVERLKANGFLFELEPTDQPWLWREAYLRDPDGHLLCLFHAGENRLNPPWRLPDAQPST